MLTTRACVRVIWSVRDAVGASPRPVIGQGPENLQTTDIALPQSVDLVALFMLLVWSRRARVGSKKIFAAQVASSAWTVQSTALQPSCWLTLQDPIWPPKGPDQALSPKDTRSSAGSGMTMELFGKARDPPAASRSPSLKGLLPWPGWTWVGSGVVSRPLGRTLRFVSLQGQPE